MEFIADTAVRVDCNGNMMDARVLQGAIRICTGPRAEAHIHDMLAAKALREFLNQVIDLNESEVTSND